MKVSPRIGDFDQSAPGQRVQCAMADTNSAVAVLGLSVVKINLRVQGYRLAYQVQDKLLVATVVAKGKREKVLACLAVKKRE